MFDKLIKSLKKSDKKRTEKNERKRSNNKSKLIKSFLWPIILTVLTMGAWPLWFQYVPIFRPYKSLLGTWNHRFVGEKNYVLIGTITFKIEKGSDLITGTFSAADNSDGGSITNIKFNKDGKLTGYWTNLGQEGRFCFELNRSDNGFSLNFKGHYLVGYEHDPCNTYHESIYWNGSKIFSLKDLYRNR